MSVKDCSHHKDRRRKLIRRFCAGLLIFNLILLIMILLVWAILQPKKPRFILQDATVYAFNVSAPNFVTSTIQITISSRNPNDKIGIYYDKLDVYAIYRSQQITYYTGIPPTYQGHKDVNVWSPFISGVNVPVAPYNGIALSQEQAGGSVQLIIKIDARVRWKVGTFTSGKYRLHVKCPAFLTFGSQTTGIVVGNAIKYQLVQRCGVSV
ncbi:NDR1/HIN1-like protein 1 [Cornus florida]|uniref:NDR1/HIN1-like protein 1 n=1 Tax=Cornus florida TaxID=4283 RepID=UPI00289712E3|nr:NDR1/HIN1-like protein 1 [Cornus florida]